MSQSIENKIVSIEDILKILHSEAQKLPPSPTSSRYLLALRSLTAAAGSLPEATDSSASSAPPAPQREFRELCTDWIVSQWLTATPYSTASLNLDIISALYGSAVKASLLPKTELFSQLKARLKALGSRGWTSGINEEIFDRALRLTKNAHRLLLDDSIAADLIILSLTHGLLPIEQLAMLRRHSDPESHAKAAEEQRPQMETDTALPASLRSLREIQKEPLVQQIIDRHSPNARKKYIFPLYQSQRTETALKKHVFKITNALFRRARLPQSTDPNQTVEALWAYAALRTGIPASRVVAHLDHLHPGHAPLGLPVLKLCKSSVFSLQSSESGQAAEESDCVALKTEDLRLKTIGIVFLDNPPRWYALSLRPGVRFTQLCRRLELLSKLKTEDSRLKTEDLTLFYPCEEIARAIGRKIVIKQRPFIHSVVFFKAKLTDIGPLLSRIGDLAWCYRQSARPGAPYAEISQQQFRLFQQTIATFTPDYEVAPTGELELKKDDRVRIVGGLFAGHEATVDSVGTHGSCVRPPSGNIVPSEASNLKPEASPTVYRLNIIGDNGIEWRIRTDSRLLKPTS